ncbi:MAG TPA: SHOCT domain-containing protein [Candidatus Saccharimonadales bacterium]|nr:SHOCT domain-containing protein [Candidatus Saccharimonadales bacterium]
MNEETPKNEAPSTATDQSTFKMSSALFVFYVVILVVAVALFILSGSLKVFVAVVGIGALILILLLLRFIFTSVTIGDNGIDYRMGWLNTTLKQIPFDKINTVDSFVSIYGRVLGFGTVKVFSGNDVEGIWFTGMEKPHILCQMIEDRVAKETDPQPTAQTVIDPADEIAKLDKLRDEGTITDQEFDAKKKQLLGL